MNAKRKERVRLIVVSAILLGAGVLYGAVPLSAQWSTLLLACGLTVLLWHQYRSHRSLSASLNSIRKRQVCDYCQQEALVSISATIRPRLPLPDMRSWAASPDFLKRLLIETGRVAPRTVLELGSGVSSIVLAYYVEQNLPSGCSVVSVDQSDSFAEQTRQLASAHRLSAVLSVHHAPLVEMSIGDWRGSWYDLGALTLPDSIDMLVIDGPATPDPFGRYPALPLLLPRLRNGAIVVLDDAGRQGERGVVARWQHEFPVAESTYYHLEKGCAVLRVAKP